MRRRVESIYSKQPEKPKTACQRKPTAPLALSSTERLHKKFDLFSRRYKHMSPGRRMTLLQRLVQLWGSGEDPVEVIKQSIRRDWDDFDNSAGAAI